MGSSLASCLVLGGVPQAPKCTDRKKLTYMRERAKRACASKTYIFRSQITSAYIKAMQFPFITYGMAL